MKKVLGYVIQDSVVTKEQANILTHIHVAFGNEKSIGLCHSGFRCD